MSVPFSLPRPAPTDHLTIIVGGQLRDRLMKLAGFFLFLFVFVTSEGWAANGDSLVISQDGAALHDGPREDAPVLLRLNRGHPLVEEERRDSWVRVTVPGVLLPGRETWLP